LVGVFTVDTLLFAGRHLKQIAVAVIAFLLS